MTHTQNQASSRARRASRRNSQLLTLSACVRSVALTPLGHVSCVLDTPAGRLKALSDAAGVHLPELQAGTQVQVVLLRLHRVTADAVWHWQLLCCRAMRDEPVLLAARVTAGSRA